jgi:hypothetical protein
MGFFNWVRSLFGSSGNALDRYADFPDPQAQAEADERETQNIHEGYYTGDAPWRGGGEEGGGDEPPEEPPEEPDPPAEPAEEPEPEESAE